VLDLQPL
jgi:hypothetical protein